MITTLEKKTYQILFGIGMIMSGIMMVIGSIFDMKTFYILAALFYIISGIIKLVSVYQRK